MKIRMTRVDAQGMAGRRVDRSLRSGRSKGLPPLVGMALAAFGLLVVVAILLDGSRFKRQLTEKQGQLPPAADLLVEMATSTNRYVDEDLAFSIALPPRWSFQQGDAVSPFDIRFNGPAFMYLSIQSVKVPYTSIDTLVGRLQAIERDQGVNTHIQRIEFKGYPGVRRFSRLNRETLHMLDVIASGREYHLQLSVPSELSDTYLAVIQDMLGSFAPIEAVAGDEASL
jgi:hypothetical protein